MELLKYLADVTDTIKAHAAKKYPQNMWMFDIQHSFWHSIKDARANGKKLVMFGAAVPPEIAYAMDLAVMIPDAISTRLASTPELINHYIDIAEEQIPASVCGIDKGILGFFASGDIEELPEAFVYSTVPCDSGRVAYAAIADILRKKGVPTYNIDVPYRKDEYGFRYIAEELKGVVEWLEKTLDVKLDWDKMKEVMKLSNKATELLAENGKYRAMIPCPMPGRMLVLNELYTSMLGTQALVDFLQAELDMAKANVAAGRGAVKDERYRVCWLQNMVWSNVGLMDWLEREYGAVVIMDGMGYDRGILCDNIDDPDEVYYCLGKRALATPMIHASSGPAGPWVELAAEMNDIYSINLSMFIGHVGCKHTWAASKLVTDEIKDRFGLPTLYLDLDAIDGRYKTTEEIKATIAEYMETIGAEKLSKK